MGRLFESSSKPPSPLSGHGHNLDFRSPARVKVLHPRCATYIFEFFTDIRVREIHCGAAFSLAVSENGQVYTVRPHPPSLIVAVGSKQVG